MLNKEEMGEITVSSRDFAKQRYLDFAAVITIGDPGYPQFVVPAESGVKQLILEFDDAISLRGNTKLVSEEQLTQAIEFAREHQDAKLLIHCGAGERRSPAVAMVIIADRLGKGREEDAINYVLDTYKDRDLQPNEHVIEVGDHALERETDFAWTYYTIKEKRLEEAEAARKKLMSKPTLVKSKKRWR